MIAAGRRDECLYAGSRTAATVEGGVFVEGGGCRADLGVDGVTVAEYLTFVEVMAQADIHLFVQ